MEKFSAKHTEASPSNPQMPEMSRRNFLRTIMAGGIAAGVLSGVEAKRLLAAEVKEGMSWKEGIRALRSAVYKPHANEEFAVFVRRKNGKDGWHMPREGSRTEFLVSFSEFADIEQSIRRNEVEKIVEAHTHPIDTAMIDKAEGGFGIPESDVHSMRAHTKPMISMPPSIDDIKKYELLYIKKHASDAVPSFFTKMESIVADPRGIWLYQPIEIPKKPLAREFIKAKQEVVDYLFSVAKIITERLEKFSDKQFKRVMDIIIHHGGSVSNTHSGSIAERRKKKINDIFSALFTDKLIEEKEIMKHILSDPEMRTYNTFLQHQIVILRRELAFHEIKNGFVQKSLKGPLTREDYATLIDAYEGLGINLKFYSYKDLGL